MPEPATADAVGDRIGYASDEFNSRVLHPRWSWVRPEATDTSLGGGSNNASVLGTPAPAGDWVVETKVRLDLPPEGCCFNFVQAGLVVYGDDDDYLKLVHVGIFETRQTEFAKERSDAPPGHPFYGNTVVGPPSEWTWLRIVKRTVGDEEQYRAYTSRDGSGWVRGGVWTHALGSEASIGLVSIGGPGFTATFDYVRTYELAGGS